MRDAGMCDARIKGGHTLRYLEARRQKETVAFSYNELVNSDLSGFLSDDSSAYTVNLKRDVTGVTSVWRHI